VATKNGTPRDLLARRLLNLERAQQATNIRLDMVADRVKSLESETRGLRADLNTGLRALLLAVERLGDKIDAVAALGPRVGALEARVAELEAKRPDA